MAVACDFSANSAARECRRNPIVDGAADRVGFEMLGDQAAWRAFGDLAAAIAHRQAFGSLSASDNPSMACWPL